MTDFSPDTSLSQVYLQISANILESFPRFRPPVDLYVFKPDLNRVDRLHRAGKRLGIEAQARVAGFAREGLLFLLRDDYQVYAEHLSRKLGLVLVEDGLDAREVAEIFFLAFRERMEAFLDQPREEPLRLLERDLSILAEYLWVNPCRVEFLTRSLNKEYGLAVHSVNTMFIGLALYGLMSAGNAGRMELVRIGLGLILHDLGMTAVPRFITDKTSYLVRRDRESIEKHIDAGLGRLQRLNVSDEVVLQCVTQHHERLDGSGYPDRLRGTEIGGAGRLCAVADSFSAMIGDRPYRDGRVVHEAAAKLAAEGGRYDQGMVAALVRLLEQGYPACVVSEAD
ncbi:HD-GYP domain-containing protein [Pseudodesulfovibrio tunisiensis]|uniref:HD-GYP domain-containing protein n=1 Tax=Pseudodesulfovibrio tunisiensis TaxID=463192 RepID=UPI001FB4AFF7|nr:HD domain-containing phosphohydrolase [Pseudodesulfovibrio tunisiensis]